MFAMRPVSVWAARLMGAQPAPAWQWAVAFLGTFVLLLPATAAMGATLPAMERMTAALRGERRSVAALYAGNTFGAVVGVLATAFWLIPRFGLARTAGRLHRAEPGVRHHVADSVSRGACGDALPPTLSGAACPAKRREGECLLAPRAHRPARDRIRGARRAGALPGDGRHRVHVRDVARRLPRGHRRGRGGLPAASGPGAQPRAARRPAARRAGRGLRGRHGVAVGGRTPAGGGPASPGRRPARGRGRRGGARARRVRTPDAGHGRAVQPPERSGDRLRHPLRARARRQHARRRGRAGVVGRAGGSGARGQGRVAADLRRLPGADRAAGLVAAVRLGAGGRGRSRWRCWRRRSRSSTSPPAAASSATGKA